MFEAVKTLYADDAAAAQNVRGLMPVTEQHREGLEQH
jgi:hypothetical protein